MPLIKVPTTESRHIMQPVIVKNFSSSEEIRRIVTNAARKAALSIKSIKTISTRLNNAKPSTNLFVSPRPMETAFNEFLQLASGLEPFTVRGPNQYTKPRRGQKKPAPVNTKSIPIDFTQSDASKLTQLVDENEQRIRTLDHIKGLVLKHFDSTETSISKILSETDSIISRLTDSIEKAKATLSDKSSVLVPDQVKLLATKLAAFVKSLKISANEPVLNYSLRGSNGKVDAIFVSIYTKGAKVLNIKTDFNVILTARVHGELKQGRFSYLVKTVNREVSAQDLDTIGQGERVATLEQAKNVIRHDLGAEEKHIPNKREIKPLPSAVDNAKEVWSGNNLITNSGASIVLSPNTGKRNKADSTTFVTDTFNKLFMAIKPLVYRMEGKPLTFTGKSDHNSIRFTFKRANQLPIQPIFYKQLLQVIGLPATYPNMTKIADAIKKA